MSVHCVFRDAGLYTAEDLVVDRLLIVTHLHLYHDETQGTPARSSSAGVFKINELREKEYKLSLQTWSAVTRLQELDLRTWVTQTVFPSLPLFLEWRAGCNSQKHKPGAISRRDMVQSMRDDLGLIKQPPEMFVKGTEVSTTTV